MICAEGGKENNNELDEVIGLVVEYFMGFPTTMPLCFEPNRTLLTSVCEFDHSHEIHQ